MGSSLKENWEAHLYWEYCTVLFLGFDNLQFVLGISWFSLFPHQDLVLDMIWLVRVFRWVFNNAKQYSWFLNLWRFRAIVSSSQRFHISLTWYGVALKLHECCNCHYLTENYLNPNWERGDDAKRPESVFYLSFPEFLHCFKMTLRLL